MRILPSWTGRACLLFGWGVLSLGCSAWKASTGEVPPAQSAAPAPVDPSELVEVTAVVQSFHARAHEEFFADGSVWVSDVVVFSVLAPAGFNDGTLSAHLRGHPRIDGEPLLLGDVVTFKLWLPGGTDLAFEHLKDLQLKERPAGGPSTS